MADKVEIWATINCKDPIKSVLLNRGIAMGNEYRFDNVAWKVLVTRTGDLFLEVLRQAVEHRLLDQYDDVELIWRLAIGPDELLLVPPSQDRQRLMPKLREIMTFLRGLLYERRFVATVLRGVLGAVIDTRAEERILAGTLHRDAVIVQVVDRLNAMDLDKEGVGAEQAAAAATTSTDDVAATPPETPQLRIAEPPPPEQEGESDAASEGADATDPSADT